MYKKLRLFVSQEARVNQDHKDSQGTAVHREQQVVQDLQETLDLQACLAHKELLVIQVSQGLLDSLVKLEPLDQKDKLDQLDLKDRLVIKGRQGHQVIIVKQNGCCFAFLSVNMAEDKTRRGLQDAEI